MKLLLGIFLLAAAIVLSSCDTFAKSTATKTPATPAAAVAPPPPPAPTPPISMPQTEIHLPPAQPVSNEALATIQPAPEPKAPEPDEPEPTTKPPARRPPAPRPAESTAPAATAETPPAQPPPSEERPRLQPVYTDEERRRILGEIERRKGEIETILRGINQSRVPSNQRGVIDSIHSFLSSCDDSAKRGDLRSAEALSERALILARELASGR